MASYFNKNRFSNNRTQDNRTSGNRYNRRRNTNNLFIQTNENENENVQKTYSIEDDFPSLGGIQNTNKDLSSNNYINANTNKWANLVKNIDNNVIFNIKNIDMSNYVKQDKIRKNTEKYTLNKMKNNYDSINDDNNDNMNNYLTFSDNESFYSDECQYYSDCETE